MLFKFLDAVPRHKVVGDGVVDVAGGGRCSRVRTGLIIFTNNPARVAAGWRRGSFGFLDFVFFHVVTCATRVEEFSRHSPPDPFDMMEYVTRAGSWKLGWDGVPLTLRVLV